MKVILWTIALIVTGLVTGMLALLVLHGAGNLDITFLVGLPKRSGREGGILPILVSTTVLAGSALAAALPLGVGAALYLHEYAPSGRFVSLLRTLLEVLAGVPSILFGLFGFSLFVIRLQWGWSLAAGSATLTLMLLPIVIRTAGEALAAVPVEQREGAVALGATKWQRTRRILLPQAAPGIVAGGILAMGKAMGETAAVMLTAGTSLRMPTSPLDPGRTMAVHLYILVTEGLSDDRAHSTALLLIASILTLNLLANLVMERWGRA